MYIKNTKNNKIEEYTGQYLVIYIFIQRYFSSSSFLPSLSLSLSLSLSKHPYYSALESFTPRIYLFRK